MSRFVRENVVHFGNRVDTEYGLATYLLCEKDEFFGALYGWRSLKVPPVFELGVEVFDDVDCMTCLVAEGRRHA